MPRRSLGASSRGADPKGSRTGRVAEPAGGGVGKRGGNILKKLRGGTTLNQCRQMYGGAQREWHVDHTARLQSLDGSNFSQPNAAGRQVPRRQQPLTAKSEHQQSTESGGESSLRKSDKPQSRFAHFPFPKNRIILRNQKRLDLASLCAATPSSLVAAQRPRRVAW